MRRPRLELAPLAAGGTVGAVSLVAIALIADLSGALDDDDGTALVFPLLAVALVGLAAAGWIAARLCRRAPLIHAAAAALTAVVAVGVAGLVRQVIIDDDISWAPAAAWPLLAIAAGIAGGLAALRPRPRADSPGE